MSKEVKEVGVASYMPATQGFTMACFKAEDVAEGCKLYIEDLAAANKAAEEDGLPEEGFLYGYFRKNGKHFDMLKGRPNVHTLNSGWVPLYTTKGAADRASRQVANKAEVDLSSLQRFDMLSCVGSLNEYLDQMEDGEYVRYEDVEALLATPPATTGASTAGLKRDAERHRYTRATTTAVRDPESGERIEVTPEMYDAAIDRAIADDPDFSKGIKSRHLVGASTVLTDERIIGMAKAACVDATRLSTVFDFARAIEREVAAQAGQVAVPESSRAAAYDAVAQALEGIYYCGRVWEAWNVGTMGKDDFTPAGEVDDVVNELVDAVISSISAPSPAKESK